MRDRFKTTTRRASLYGTRPIGHVRRRPTTLNLNANIRGDRRLVRHFRTTGMFLQHFTMSPCALNNGSMLIGLPTVPVPPLFVRRILHFVVNPIGGFVSFRHGLRNRDLSIVVSNGFRLPFLRSSFFKGV